METLLEVGLVEALAAGAFIGFCAFVSFLLRTPNRMTEAELTEMLHQISRPDTPDTETRSPTPSTTLSYRGSRYKSRKETWPETWAVDEPGTNIQVEPYSATQTEADSRVPDSIVRLTYRGVSYVKPRYEGDED